MYCTVLMERDCAGACGGAVPYRVVEVNPLYKGELAWSEYKKVPVVTVAGEQLNDSTNIMVTLSARMGAHRSVRPRI
jgi:microsomal prostaglandin-E synthase 2